MAVSDLDIFRAANQVIKQFGDGALSHAQDRAEYFSRAGDVEGAAVWKRIGNAICALLQPPTGTLN